MQTRNFEPITERPHPRSFHPLAIAAFLLAVVLAVVLALACAAAPRKHMSLPDLTRGEAIPAGANHDWTLGATGVRGWMFSDKLETTAARQVAITRPTRARRRMAFSRRAT